MRFLIKFSYDGTNYSGFQKQRGLETIEGKLEEALTKVNNGIKTTITATGRTDKGVHALVQYGHADINVNITEKKLKRALNSNLPRESLFSTQKVRLLHLNPCKHVAFSHRKQLAIHRFRKINNVKKDEIFSEVKYTEKYKNSLRSSALPEPTSVRKRTNL